MKCLNEPSSISEQSTRFKAQPSRYIDNVTDKYVAVQSNIDLKVHCSYKYLAGESKRGAGRRSGFVLHNPGARLKTVHPEDPPSAHS